jgi:uncharacterized protein YceH (UPF0502 family)
MVIEATIFITPDGITTSCCQKSGKEVAVTLEEARLLSQLQSICGQVLLSPLYQERHRSLRAKLRFVARSELCNFRGSTSNTVVYMY